jgi:hypothetical protein
MVRALVPIWILGGSYLAVILLNVLFSGGHSAMRRDSDATLASTDARRTLA